MIINLSPVRMDEELLVDREGDVLYVNGEVFDFSQLQDGSTLPADAISSRWFAGPVERVNGELQITLFLPHGPDAITPHETRFPQPIVMTDDGSVDIPVHSIPQPEIEVADNE